MGRDTVSFMHEFMVSCMDPFYGSYAVFEPDKVAYQYAFVAGYNKSCLCLLPGTPASGN
jgi:lipocalin